MKKDYRFVEKDPVIDVIRTAIERPLFSSDRQAAYVREVAAKARLHPSTIDNILYGRTKRPQHHTVTQLLGVLGARVAYLWADGAELRVANEVWRRFTKKRKVVRLERKAAS